MNAYAYSPYGSVAASQEKIPNPFKYVGKYGVMDEGNGLYFMRARYYAPEVGMFIGKDPIGFAGGINRYGYCISNPTNCVDPLGLWYIDINLSLGYWGGGTGGILVNSKGIYPYAGGGLVSPPGGIAVTWSPSDISPGWHMGFQAGFWGGLQIGYRFGDGGDTFWEIGFVTPGFSVTGYHAWGKNKEKDKCKKSSQPPLEPPTGEPHGMPMP